jgi:hypothetical protein
MRHSAWRRVNHRLYFAYHVTLLDEPLNETGVRDEVQGTRMAAALERLAKIQALAEIEDAAVWERATRQDRALPDRG